MTSSLPLPGETTAHLDDWARGLADELAKIPGIERCWAAETHLPTDEHEPADCGWMTEDEQLAAGVHPSQWSGPTTTLNRPTEEN